jgi:hypothetical protein
VRPRQERRHPLADRLADRLPLVVLGAALLLAVLLPTLRPLVGSTAAMAIAGFPALALVVGAMRIAAGDPPRIAALRATLFAAAVVAIYWIVFMPRRPAWMG